MEGGCRMRRHPARVCMTYCEHWRFALWLSGKLALASAASFVHAFVPDILEHTSSDIIAHLVRVLRRTGCRDIRDDSDAPLNRV